MRGTDVQDDRSAARNGGTLRRRRTLNRQTRVGSVVRRGALTPADVVSMLDAYAILQARGTLQLNDQRSAARSSTGSSGLHQTLRRAQQERRSLQSSNCVDWRATGRSVDENAIGQTKALMKRCDDLEERSGRRGMTRSTSSSTPGNRHGSACSKRRSASQAGPFVAQGRGDGAEPIAGKI